MPKRITAITIQNFRAYYGQYDRFDLTNGENLLIYGENGSGKSSLFKALENYFRSSNEVFPFSLNRYHAAAIGEVRIEFSDIDVANNQIIAGSQLEYFFASNGSDNQVSFIQEAALVNGFLDYTDLLDVYFHNDPNPNLFNLLVLSLLGNHIPVTTGGTYRFRTRWNQLQNNLTVNATKRTDWTHRLAKQQLPVFELQLRTTLDEVFVELNRLLQTYFSDLQITLDYALLPLNFNYGWKPQWHTTADLRLLVTKDGVPIAGDYNQFLNEARLSAIAICLYLASLLINPAGIDLKVLFLDDIFIGLDAGNRLPILEILRNEFGSYQKFISTYDRHWFELAKKQFETRNESSWNTLEIYVGTEDIGGTTINKPILVRGESHWEKAIKYLHHRSAPDYPAAANYFRKALEELIQDFVPDYELVDIEYTQIADYKLTTLIKRTKKFLEKTGNDSTEVQKIMGLLHNLLHPLSHHEISSPVYKAELIIIENAFQRLKAQLIALDIENTYKCRLEPTKNLKLNFIDAPANYHSHYELVLKEPLVLIKDHAGQLTFAKCECNVVKCYGFDNGTPIKPYHPQSNDPNFNYKSLEDAINKIHGYLTLNTGHAFLRPAHYVDQIEYKDILMAWQPLSGKMIWQ